MKTMMHGDLTKFINDLKLHIETKTKQEWSTCKANWDTIDFKVGTKYIKIIRRSLYGGGGSVYMFLDFEGNIYKPAGWSKPAEGIRGHINKIDWSVVDASGGWLYVR